MSRKDITDLCYRRCYTYLDKVGVTSRPDHHVTGPLCRYILGIPLSLPLRHIILGERPYGSLILPYVSSAMSYSDEITQPTPSVHYIARDIDNHTDMDYSVARDWFRDSWKYLRQGILVMNVCTYTSFMNPMSDRERVATEELIRDLIKVSALMTGEKVHICAMGNPAQHSSGRIRSSLPNPKLQVSVHKATNPAWPSHKKGDQRSPEITLGGKSIVKYLHDVILSTVTSGLLYTFEDYNNMSGNIDSAIDKVVSTHTAVSNRFADIEAAFKSAPDGKTIDDGETLFRQAKDEIRLACKAMQEFRVRLSFANISEPAGVAKPSYMNQRKSYTSQPSIQGSVSRAPSSSSVQIKSRTIGFAGDDSEEDASTEAVATPETTADTPEPAPVSSPAPSSSPAAPRSRINRVASSTYSTASRNSKSVGFATVDEDSEAEGDAVSPVTDKGKVARVTSVKQQPSGSSVSESGSLDMTRDEIRDMEYVASHIADNDEEYDSVYVNILSEAVKSSRAQSPAAKKVLEIIRKHHSDSTIMTVRDSVGIDTDVLHVSSPIAQWLLHEATL